AATTWDAFPALWPRLLGEVWDVVRPVREKLAPGRNVMLYLDDRPHVEIGVEVAAPFPGLGRVVSSMLPAGRVATTTHRGPDEDLGRAHASVIAWCEARGLERTGVLWEVYGHATDDPDDQEVDVYHLLVAPSSDE